MKTQMMLNWRNIDTVLLDMDGTLLDLHFDNHFWLEALPAHISQQSNRPAEEIREELFSLYGEVQGTLDWYCIEHWQQRLNVDIMALKNQHAGRINWLNAVRPFLEALGKLGKQRILITNAHPLSLELKIRHTNLDRFLDQQFSTHQFGFAKESARLWHLLEKRCGYDPKRTLFIDDNEQLLKTAKEAGIAWQLGVYQPDSQQPGREMQQFETIKSYQALTEQLLGQCRER